MESIQQFYAALLWQDQLDWNTKLEKCFVILSHLNYSPFFSLSMEFVSIALSNSRNASDVWRANVSALLILLGIAILHFTFRSFIISQCGMIVCDLAALISGRVLRIDFDNKYSWWKITLWESQVDHCSCPNRAEQPESEKVNFECVCVCVLQ